MNGLLLPPSLVWAVAMATRAARVRLCKKRMVNSRLFDYEMGDKDIIRVSTVKLIEREKGSQRTRTNECTK